MGRDNDIRVDVLWKKFESMYERKINLNKSSCLKQITWIRYKDRANMIEHLSNFQDLMNQATTVTLNLNNDVQA